ncbi:hypothetical protein [Deinococcus soli (ex Cha et al. 2016)]|uniref:hypothetical protein n=1 Tax=Deinococcus soli (ex Cha et al. 2016) TaxID=1309411 RepID=UPI001662F5B1|nr:hypothetical protein [Deinococcus soli (ex Cha et al. 2016)]GGB76582.1 hypothetical protein GCM10008019_36000 [Deinococcus soli (ex Cha et al. 2016)]
MTFLSSLVGSAVAAIGPNAAWDLLKYLAVRPRAHAERAAVQRALLTSTRQFMDRQNVTPDLAARLTDALNIPSLLQQAATLSLDDLEASLLADLRDAGFHPLQADLAAEGFVRAVFTQFTVPAVAGSVLADDHYRRRRAEQAQRQETQHLARLRDPHVAAGTLAAALQSAGQQAASLAVQADGTVRITGSLTLTVSATGAARDILARLPEELDAGRRVVIDAAMSRELKVTAGHPYLDQLLHLTEPASYAFAPMPSVRTERLRVTSDGRTAETTVRVTTDPEAHQVTADFTDLRAFDFQLRWTATQFGWKFTQTPEHPVPTQADRAALESVTLIGTENFALHFLDSDVRLPRRTFDLRLDRVRSAARYWLNLLILQDFIAGDLGLGTLTLGDKKRVTEADARFYAQLASAVTGAGMDQALDVQFRAVLTPVLLQGLTAKHGMYVRSSRSFTLDRDLELQLTHEFARPIVTVRYQGRRVPKKQLPGLVGQAVDLSWTARPRSVTLEPQDDVD